MKKVGIVFADRKGNFSGPSYTVEMMDVPCKGDQVNLEVHKNINNPELCEKLSGFRSDIFKVKDRCFYVRQEEPFVDLHLVSEWLV